jgi:hypothetical protein
LRAARQREGRARATGGQETARLDRAVLVSGALLVAPVYSSGQTLAQVNEPSALVIIAIPVAIALSALVVRRLKTPAAVAMCLFVILSGFSIGLFYLPSAVLLALPEQE